MTKSLFVYKVDRTRARVDCCQVDCCRAGANVGSAIITRWLSHRLFCVLFSSCATPICVSAVLRLVSCLMSLQEAAGASTIFVDVLWAMVVLVGCSMSLGGCMVAYRHFKAGGGGAPMYLPVQGAVSTRTCTYICTYFVCIMWLLRFCFFDGFMPLLNSLALFKTNPPPTSRTRENVIYPGTC